MPTLPPLTLQRGSLETIENFQVFGERCSGTNYVSTLIARNVKIRETGTYGWKHGFPCAVGYNPRSLIFVVSRDPIGWLVSLFNTPRSSNGLAEKDFSNFIRKPFLGRTSHKRTRDWRKRVHSTVPAVLPDQAIQHDLNPITGVPYATPMELRSMKYRAYLGFLNRLQNVGIVQFEYARKEPEYLLDAITNVYGIKRRSGFDPVREKVDPDRTFPGRTRINAEDISAGDRAHIRSRLDLDLERRLGYSAAIDTAG